MEWFQLSTNEIKRLDTHREIYISYIYIYINNKSGIGRGNKFLNGGPKRPAINQSNRGWWPSMQIIIKNHQK